VSTHLRDAYIAIPISEVFAVSRGCDAMNAVQAVCRWNDLWAVLAVLVEPRIVLAFTPGVVDRFGPLQETPLNSPRQIRSTDNGANLQPIQPLEPPTAPGQFYVITPGLGYVIVDTHDPLVRSHVFGDSYL
jgi:hypothetical protein